MAAPLPEPLTPDALRDVSSGTVAHYERDPQGFWEATRDHDVTQNREALLGALASTGAPPYRILDFGCGPGRDTAYFKSQGHDAVGLDGTASFVAMARALTNDACEVWHQDFLALALPDASFDGVFANASLFHVPRQELPRVARELRATLKPHGALFCSNPRAMGRPDREGWNGGRFGNYMDVEGWRAVFEEAGFVEVDCFYRPSGKPRDEQPWLAMVWRRHDD